MGRDIIIEEEGIGGIDLYQTPDGQTNLEVKLENDTVWLTRQQMALLFGRDVKTIGKHINNALKEELAGELVVAKFATPKKYGRREGFEQTQYPEYYSLEMITSVGFRVKSKNGVVFRRWANSVLKEYLIKGYAVKNNLIQERYDELKALVDTLGRTMLRLEIRNTSGKETFHATYENETVSRRNSEKALCLQMRRTSLSAAPSDRFTRPGTARTSILQWRRRPQCCYISSQRTILLLTVTRGLRQLCFCGLWRTTAFSTP